jgi:hypothetical protein
MPVSADSPAPYAPGSAILGVVSRHRTKGLPLVVDHDVLTRAGVSETLAPRTLQALKSLDLIGDDGKLTETFEGLRLAPESEYQQRMVDWLRSAYADVLTYVDPETATEVQLRDAFRTYIPTGQQTRMVSLFQALFAAAGIGAERQRQPVKRTPSGNGATKPKPATARVARSRQPLRSHLPPAGEQRHTLTNSLPPALAGLIASLPADGRWTQAQRDKFMTAFPVMLDYAFEIVPEADLAVDDIEAGNKQRTVATPNSPKIHDLIWRLTCGVLPGGKEVRHVVHGPDISG